MNFKQTYYWRGALRGALLVAFLLSFDGTAVGPEHDEVPSTAVQTRIARDLARVSSLAEASELLKLVRMK